MFRLRISTVHAAATPSSAGARGKAARLLLLTACLFAMLLTSSAQAQPGVLDPSFGAGGKVTTAIGSSSDAAQAIALQPDGKLVVAGGSVNGALYDFALARYYPDGSLDAGFGAGGKLTTAIGAGIDEAHDLALQPDGKIVAAGRSWIGSNDDFSLARYNPNGSLDASFNGTGKVTTPIGSGFDVANALVRQPDGKLVAAGYSDNGSNLDFALARYNPNGSLDTSFNGTGKVTTAIGSGYDAADALAVQPDGKLVVAGYGSNGSNNDFALVRYNPNGSLDTSFGTGGKVTTAIGPGHDTASGLALQPDGKIVAAGGSIDGNGHFALVRYNANGSLDTSFGTGGKVTTAIGSSDDSAHGLVLQPDGKLVAAGYSWNGSNNDFAVARYNADGSLDAGFGAGGKLTTAIGAGMDEAYGLALQPDGRLVVAGKSWNNSNPDFALARYVGGTLTVVKAGSGSGSVTSSSGGIDCGSSCGPAAARPKITRLRVTPTRVRIGSRLPKLVRRPARRPLATIGFRVSKRAIVTLRFAKLRTNGAPRKLTTKVRFKARKGRNRIRFAARLTRRVALKPGSYRLTAVATDRAGRRSTRARTRFTALKPAGR
jgi:uncharacterized delta-60 repeat protein